VIPMRIRLYTAVASTNSGSYTIVGRFRDAATAEEVARVIQEACDAHHAWHEENSWTDDGVSPLDEFVRREGLSAEKPGRNDEWPQYGDKPTALASGRQVIVHAPYTVTMPAVFGELFYKRGGRVEAELDHTHDDLAVELAYWPDGVSWSDPRRGDLLDAFEARLHPELPAWTARGEHDKRPAIAPVFHRGFWGSRHLSAVFVDLIEGVEGVRRIARETGTHVHVRVWECPHGQKDPFAALRSTEIPWGQYRVILWQIGPDRIAAMKAVREALGAGLADAKTALEDLPREVLVDVAEDHARAAAETLRRAGCDAEVVVPAARD
jgi:ribosomal protein L7/L12